MPEQMFNTDLVVIATAVATHPEGAVVPPPVPAAQADSDKEQ